MNPKRFYRILGACRTEPAYPMKKERMNQRFQLAAGQLPKTHVIRKTRREIARVKTQLNAAD